jgi:hypothetical protein
MVSGFVRLSRVDRPTSQGACLAVATTEGSDSRAQRGACQSAFTIAARQQQPQLADSTGIATASRVGAVVGSCNCDVKFATSVSVRARGAASQSGRQAANAYPIPQSTIVCSS